MKKLFLILGSMLIIGYGCGNIDVTPQDSTQTVEIPDTNHTVDVNVEDSEHNITYGYDLQGMYDFFEDECRFHFRKIPNSNAKETMIKECTYNKMDKLLENLGSITEDK